MLLLMDQVQIAEDCMQTKNSTCLLWPGQTKYCQNCNPNAAHIPLASKLYFRTYLGTPGGARLGREGTWGGGPKGSGEAPGLEGTGGAPPSVDPPAGGGPGAGPRDPGLAGGTAGALLCGVGLDVGDLTNREIQLQQQAWNSSCFTTRSPYAAFSGPSSVLCHFKHYPWLSRAVPGFIYLQSCFRPHLTYRFSSFHIFHKDIAALHSLQGIEASQHKHPELLIHREKRRREGLPVSVGGPS